MRFQNNIGHLIIQIKSLMGLEQIVVLVQAVRGKVIGFFFPRKAHLFLEGEIGRALLFWKIPFVGSCI